MIEGKIGVVGAGTMGSAIAEVMAFNGFEVVLRDINQQMLDRGRRNIERILEHLIQYHEKRAPDEISRIESLGVRLSEQQKEVIRSTLKPLYDAGTRSQVLGRIHLATDWDALADCRLVVEAAFERLEVKQDVLKELDKRLPVDAIFATNTSSIPITAIASASSHPERCLGAHFFNPPYTLPLIEIIPGMRTSAEVVDEAFSFFARLKNHRRQMLPIKVKESPGFVVNRILVPAQNEACFILQEGLASAKDIDEAMKAGAGWPMGPLELADMVGLDVAYDVSIMLFREFGDPKYRPPLLLRRMVEAGLLGRKSGSGFYKYVDGKKQ
ncbi:MAG: 3-hydroxyacyl-CoA dehydrogenase family protein [Methanomassiliicoccales archaeon]